MVDYCQVASRYTQQELIILINDEGWALNNILKGTSKTERWGQKQKADHGTINDDYFIILQQFGAIHDHLMRNS